MNAAAIAIGLSSGLALVPAPAGVIVGIFDTSAPRQSGFDERTVVLVRIEAGDWKLSK